MTHREQRRYLRLFQEITRLITSTLDKDRVMALIVQKVPEVVGVDAATIRLFDDRGEELVLLAAHGLSDAYLNRGPVDMEPGVKAALAGTPVTIFDAPSDPRIVYSKAARKEGIKSILVAPIPIGGEISGVLRLLTRTPRAYREEEIEFAAAIAEQCGIAIENARAYSEQQRQVNYFKTLNEIGRMLNSTQQLRTVLNVITRRLPEVMSLKGCTIRLLNPSGRQLELVAASGLSETYLARGSIDTELSTHQALKGTPVMIANATEDVRNRYRKAAREEGIASILAVPIEVKGQTIGVLRLLTGERRVFSDAEIAFARAVAEQGGAAILNARHFEKILNLVTELEQHEEFLQNVIDNLDADLFVLDSDFRFVMVNRIFLKNHGLKEPDVLGRPCAQILRAGNNQEPVIREMLAKKQNVIYSRTRDVDGRSVHLEVAAAPVSIYREDGKTDLIIGSIRDVTDHVRLQEEQRAREKLQGVLEMAGAAAHELNTPVFSALGTAQLLAADVKKSPNLAEDIATIIRNLKTVSEMTRKMTQITRYEAKEYVDNTRIVDIERSSS